MARRRSEVEELVSRIQELPKRKKLNVLERVLTPEIEMDLMLQEARRKMPHIPGRIFKQAVRRAMREVQSKGARRAFREALDVEMINRSAKALNREMADILTYQARI